MKEKILEIIEQYQTTQGGIPAKRFEHLAEALEKLFNEEQEKERI